MSARNLPGGRYRGKWLILFRTQNEPWTLHETEKTALPRFGCPFSGTLFAGFHAVFAFPSFAIIGRRSALALLCLLSPWPFCSASISRGSSRFSVRRSSEKCPRRGAPLNEALKLTAPLLAAIDPW